MSPPPDADGLDQVSRVDGRRAAAWFCTGSGRNSRSGARSLVSRRGLPRRTARQGGVPSAPCPTTIGGLVPIVAASIPHPCGEPTRPGSATARPGSVNRSARTDRTGTGCPQGADCRVLKISFARNRGRVPRHAATIRGQSNTVRPTRGTRWACGPSGPPSSAAVVEVAAPRPGGRCCQIPTRRGQGRTQRPVSVWVRFEIQEVLLALAPRAAGAAVGTRARPSYPRHACLRSSSPAPPATSAAPPSRPRRPWCACASGRSRSVRSPCRRRRRARGLHVDRRDRLGRADRGPKERRPGPSVAADRRE